MGEGWCGCRVFCAEGRVGRKKLKNTNPTRETVYLGEDRGPPTGCNYLQDGRELLLM